jgi:hypothetical protein
MPVAVGAAVGVATGVGVSEVVVADDGGIAVLSIGLVAQPVTTRLTPIKMTINRVTA